MIFTTKINLRVTSVAYLYIINLIIETYGIANIWKGALNENGMNVGDGANII